LPLRNKHSYLLQTQTRFTFSFDFLVSASSLRLASRFRLSQNEPTFDTPQFSRRSTSVRPANLVSYDAFAAGRPLQPTFVNGETVFVPRLFRKCHRCEASSTLDSNNLPTLSAGNFWPAHRLLDGSICTSHVQKTLLQFNLRGTSIDSLLANCCRHSAAPTRSDVLIKNNVKWRLLYMNGHHGVDASHIRTSKGDSVFAVHQHGHANDPLGFRQNICFSAYWGKSASLLVKCGGVSLRRRQDYCAPQIKNLCAAGKIGLEDCFGIPAPHARFLLNECNLSYWYNVINSVFIWLMCIQVLLLYDMIDSLNPRCPSSDAPFFKELKRRESKVDIPTKDRVGYFSNGRRLSLESSLEGLSSSLFVWKRSNQLIVIQTWFWRGKSAASTREWLREANDERWHLYFPGNLLYVLNIRRYRSVWCRSVHFPGTSSCKKNAAAKCRLLIQKRVCL